MQLSSLSANLRYKGTFPVAGKQLLLGYVKILPAET